MICFIPLSHVERGGPRLRPAIVTLCATLPRSGDEGGRKMERKERQREREKCRYRFRRTIYPRKKLYLAFSGERTALSSYARTAHDRVVIIDARVRRVLDACVSRDQNRKCPFANKVKFLEIPSLDEPRNAKSRPIDFVRADKALRRLYVFCCLGRPRRRERDRATGKKKERERKSVASSIAVSVGTTRRP